MRLEEMKEPNGSWKFWIVVVIAIKISFFVVSILVVHKIVKLQRDSDEQWGHTERRYYDNWQRIDWRADV